MSWANGYTYRRSINFDHTQVGSTNLTDFPALLLQTVADLKTVANGGKIQNTTTVLGITVPADLILTSDSAGSTLLDWEIAAYDATTGLIEIWVRVPTLSHITSDTVIYLWYGNSATTTFQCTSTNTWNTNYKGVWHFGDGTTLALKDSTSNANDGTNNNGVAAGAGPQTGGGAASFVSASDKFIDVGSGSSLDLAGSDLTMEAWAYYNGSNPALLQPRIFSKIKLGGSGYNGYELLLNNPPSPGFYTQLAKNNAFSQSPNSAETGSTWYHLVATYDQANIRLYKNGTLVSTTGVAASCYGAAAVNACIGVFADNTLIAPWDGLIDEVRISNVKRSGDWVTASYNNQKASSTFTTLGAAEEAQIAPTGLPSAFVAGTAFIVATIGLTGLPSAFAAGTATFDQHLLRPPGVATGIAVGIPLVAGGSITPTGVASGEAIGLATVLEAQTVTITTGLASAFAAGLASFHHSQTIQPGGLASAEAIGSPNFLAGVQKIICTGLAPGLAGNPRFVGGSGGMQVYIAGVDHTQNLRALTAAVQSQTIGRAMATFDLHVPVALSYVPELGQTVIMVDYGNKVFAGCLNSIINERQPYTDVIIYHCQAADKSSICDHRTVKNTTYTAGMEIADVIRDIVTNFLNGEGITTQGVPLTIGTLAADQVFNFQYVTQAFDTIATDAGCIWWIDFNGVLYFTPITSLPACPIALTETSDNWRDLTVETTLLNYRNKQYVVSNLNVLPGVSGGSGAGPPTVTEIYTVPQAEAVTRGFWLGCIVLNFNALQILSLKVNGVEQPVHDGLELINFQKSWWFFPGNPYITAPNAGNDNPYFPYPSITSPYPVATDVVEISYIPGSQNVALKRTVPLSPPLGTCGSGIYEAVEQVHDVDTEANLTAIATKILARFSQIPKVLRFQTDNPGVQVGQVITVDLPRSDLASTTLFVTSIRGYSLAENLGKGGTMRWDIEAATNVDLGNWIKWFENLVRRSDNPLPVYQFEEAKFVLGPGGAAITAGVSESNPYTVCRTGQLFEVLVSFTSPPTDNDMTIDLQTVGLGSIFGNTPIRIPAGTAAFALVVWNQFASGVDPVLNPTYIYARDVIKPPVIGYSATGPNPTTAASGTVTLRWRI